MATDDNTSKPRHSRRNQPQATAASVDAVTLVGTDLPPATPPRTLEEAVENVRTLMLQVRGVLHCLSDVLLYSDDDDAVMHAEVARATAGWAQLAAAELDLGKLRPLIEAMRHRGGGEPGDGDPGTVDHGSYQVREPRPVYLV